MAVITWVDVETSGLDPRKCSLLEIAVLVTDENLNILDTDGYQAVVHHGFWRARRAYRKAVPFVQEMHTRTGLWDKLEDGKPLKQIDQELHSYIAKFSLPRTSPVGGNSVRLDMNFMDRYLPETATHLDFHMRDVSTVGGLARDWGYGLPWFEKASDHTAMTDIRESIRELRHYREAIFRPATMPVWVAADGSLHAAPVAGKGHWQFPPSHPYRVPSP